jgi:hypothetical protein
MIKPALLIAILTLAVTTMADNRMSMVRDHNFVALPPSFINPIQKPRGDELTEAFNQTLPADPDGSRQHFKH